MLTCTRRVDFIDDNPPFNCILLITVHLWRLKKTSLQGICQALSEGRWFRNWSQITPTRKPDHLFLKVNIYEKQEWQALWREKKREVFLRHVKRLGTHYTFLSQHKRTVGVWPTNNQIRQLPFEIFLITPQGYTQSTFSHAWNRAFRLPVYRQIPV